MEAAPATEPSGRGAPGALIGALVSLGVTPNMVSYAGFVFALAAGTALTFGAGHAPPWGEREPASWWPLAAGVCLALSAVADLLDGAVARGAGLQTRFGALLDSTLDRFGDVALYGGCAVYYAAHGNVSYVLISFLAAAGAVQVSYVKARGENFVAGLGVGFWQRGERIVVLLVGTASASVSAALCILAVFPLFTVLRRVRLARGLIEGTAPAEAERAAPLAPWRRSRRSLAYWAFCAAIAAAIVAAPHVHPIFEGAVDPLGDWLRKP